MRWIGLRCLALLWPLAAAAGPQHILVGLDGKTVFAPEGSRNGPDGADAVAILDVSDPARPRVAHVLALSNSVYGPPSNLGITPDGRLGLVASAVTMRRDGENWWAEPDDRLHLIDLAASPPRHLATVRVGRQPSGLAINRAGTLALVANRAGRSVSVLRIADPGVQVVGEVGVDGEAAAVAFAPDGRRAFVAKPKAGTVGVLAVEGERVTYDPALDVPADAGIYAVAATPDGRLLLTANTGAAASDGHADTASVIRLDGDRPRAVDHLGIGDTPETVAVTPDGRHAVVVVVGGSAAPHAAPSFTPGGTTVLLGIAPDGRVSVRDRAPNGAVPEGVAFSPDGSHVYVGNYADRTLQTYRLDGDRLVDTGAPLVLPGQPASLGGVAR
ncbi:YncE family protein [Methylobacterium oryzisoli]|uniref:YncE family protein n=1 Tax=Methylobacterium oryzisoli TaxID=3385502 RepID=UPI003891366B